MWGRKQRVSVGEIGRKVLVKKIEGIRKIWLEMISKLVIVKS